MDAVTADLLARIEALEMRLEAQAAEIARLMPSPAALPPVSKGRETPTAEQSRATAEDAALSRRDWLMRGAAGLAATALVASNAEAAARATLLAGSGSTVNYAVAGASTGSTTGGDPDVFLPNLTGRYYGTIGTITGLADVPATNAGVWGAAYSSDGALGTSVTGTGVRGISAAGNGVRGEINATSVNNAIAVYGLNNSSYAGPGPGAGGFGVYGLSAKGHGLVGATAAPGAAAVVGATNGVVGAYAAAFYGPVIVGGDFVVVGGAKSAAVPSPDGSHRQLYCLESPESWFEDFGTGELVDGCAEITIDPGFAAVTDLEHYHVFLTAYGRDHLLYVAKQTPKCFTVEVASAVAELAGQSRAQRTGRFSWRVVGKRKDISGPRLAVVNVPPQPELPSIATPPATAPGSEDPPLSRRRGV